MKIYFDDRNGTIQLTAKQIIIYAMVYKYSTTGDKRGWFGTVRALSESQPARDISKSTAAVILNDLLAMGLIYKEGDAYFVVQDSDNPVQVSDKTVQDTDKLVQLSDKMPSPPITPSIDKKNDKKEGTELTQAHACHARPRLPEENLFNRYIAAFWLLVDRPAEPTATQREDAARRAWIKHPDNRQLAYELIKYKHVTKKADPAFTIIDAQELRQNLPPPVNYYGLQLERFVDYYETFYNGQKGLYTADDVAFYKMPKPEEKFNI